MRDYTEAVDRFKKVDRAVVRWRPVVSFGIAGATVLLGSAVGFSWIVAGMAVAGIPAGIATGTVLRQSLPGGNGMVSRLSDTWRVHWWAVLVGGLSVGTLISAWASCAWFTSVLAIMLLASELLLGSRLAGRQAQAAGRDASGGEG